MQWIVMAIFGLGISIFVIGCKVIDLNKKLNKISKDETNHKNRSEVKHE